jgi:hypothetical protein
MSSLSLESGPLAALFPAPLSLASILETIAGDSSSELYDCIPFGAFFDRILLEF